MVLETDRLVLRPPAREDLDGLVEVHAAPEVVRFMGKFDRPTAIRWMELNERDWDERGYGRLAVFERGTDRLLGRSGLKYWPQFAETEVGWVLRPDVWGRGFATEAGRACVDWAVNHLGMPYITAMIRPDNSRSIRVAERLGMSPLRKDVLLEQQIVVYSISRDGWDAGAGRSVAPAREDSED